MLSEEELNEMKQGGIPYTPEQNEKVKEQPKIVQKSVSNNGEKLYRKCPTCGQFMEVNSPIIATSPMNLGQPMTPNLGAAQSSPTNPYIRPYPVDKEKLKPPTDGRVVSDETTEEGTPLVDAHWNDAGAGRIPNTPIRGGE